MYTAREATRKTSKEDNSLDANQKNRGNTMMGTLHTVLRENHTHTHTHQLDSPLDIQRTSPT